MIKIDKFQVYENIKNKHLYLITDIAINANNNSTGNRVIIYKDLDKSHGNLYARDLHEFSKKFKLHTEVEK